MGKLTPEGEAWAAFRDAVMNLELAHAEHRAAQDRLRDAEERWKAAREAYIAVAWFGARAALEATDHE